MKIMPGKWTILCRGCDGDLFYTIKWGWQHEGAELPDHAAQPVAINCDAMLKSMGINIVAPEVDSAIGKMAEILSDVGVPDVSGMIHAPA